MTIDSNQNVGIGLAVPESHASNGAFHLADDVELGFGNGANSRPDFGISGNSSTLNIYCGEGSDDVDLVISTGGVLQIAALTGSQDVQTDGSKNLVSVSDMNWKNDLGLVENGLDIVNALKPHYFKWIRDANENDLSTMEQPRLAGFFAQEVYAVFPEGSPGGANIDGGGEEHWGLNSRAIMAAMVKAVQELSAKFDNMDERLTNLEVA